MYKVIKSSMDRGQFHIEPLEEISVDYPDLVDANDLTTLEINKSKLTSIDLKKINEVVGRFYETQDYVYDNEEYESSRELDYMIEESAVDVGYVIRRIAMRLE